MMTSIGQDEGNDVDEGDLANDDLYDFTEDQIQAMLELDLMQRENSEYPNIEVRERLEELNNALANDPTPTDDSLRESKVVFKDNLVDLIAPPPEYPSDYEDDEEEEKVDDDRAGADSRMEESSRAEEEEEEEEKEKEEEKSEEQAINRHIAEMKLEEEEETATRNFDEATPDREPEPASPTYSTQERWEDEDEASAQVLVERNGRFILIDKKAVEAEEDLILRHTPHPPPSRRPQSAPQRRSRALQPEGTGQRTGSALSDSYNSPYAMTPEMRTERRRRLEIRNQRAKSSEQQKRDAEKDKRENADAAFQAWLRQKREQARERKSNEDKASEASSVESQERTEQTIREWVKKKRQQKRLETELRNKQMEQIYMQEQLRSHTQEEIDKAFRSWLRRKNRAAKVAAQEEKQRARITRLAVRQCRKSQALAFALHRDSSLRYVDYYGYRS